MSKSPQDYIDEAQDYLEMKDRRMEIEEELTSLKAENERLKVSNQKLTEALGFYAETVPGLEYIGERARQALAEIEEEGL